MTAESNQHEASHPPTQNDTTTTTSPSLSTKELLEQSYVYQNRMTGAVAPAPLKTRQLCRILCPASAASTHVITPDTQVYTESSGWVLAKTRPILREACAQWHYHATTSSKGGSMNGGAATESSAAVQGPVTCRELAKLVHSNALDPATTQVWSAGTGSDDSDTDASNGSVWRLVQNLPHLLAALEAFREDAAAAPQVSYDDAAMTFQSSTHGPTGEGPDEAQEAPNGSQPQESQDHIQEELEAFLSSTAHLGPNHDGDDDEEGYQSDGGTQYVKDAVSGNWIHEALAPKKKKPAPSETTSVTSKSSQQQSKKRKKPKFAAKNAKCWIYLTGLPPDATLDEVSQFTSKVGIIELDPETQRPKIKLYRHRDGPLQNQLKGDASVCYARPESVDLALQILDEAPLRPSEVEKVSQFVIRVQRAKFQQHGDTFDANKKNRISNAKRKVARLAALQAVGWDEDDVNGRITGGRKGLRIVVLKHMFDLAELKDDEDAVLAALEKEVRTECEKCGAVEKITIFSKNPQGIVIVKFTQPTVASTAVTEWEGRERNGRRVEASFWDGVTDFTVRDEEKEEHETEKRLDEFGEWLDQQEVPDEFKLQVEG